MPLPVKRSRVPSCARTISPGEAAQVEEHDDDLAPVALERIVGAPVDDRLGEGGREEALEPREPLELGHLLAHPLLERAVQLRQLVVEALDPQQGAHARQDLRLVDRLGEEVVGAGFDALHALLSGVERGDHHHRQHRRPRWHRRCSPLGSMSTRAAS